MIENCLLPKLDNRLLEPLDAMTFGARVSANVYLRVEGMHRDGPQEVLRGAIMRKMRKMQGMRLPCVYMVKTWHRNCNTCAGSISRSGHNANMLPRRPALITAGAWTVLSPLSRAPMETTRDPQAEAARDTGQAVGSWTFVAAGPIMEARSQFDRCLLCHVLSTCG